VRPSPARETRRVFHCADAVEKPLRRERRTHVIWWDEEEESESDVSAAAGAHDCARQGAPLRPLLLRFVEALSTPVVAPVMCLFGGRRDSLFLNPFK
jgi:hypothetical protein